MTMTTATEFEVHKETGLPVQSVPQYEVGDLVTEHINSDGYPGVVVHVTPKQVHVRSVTFVGNFHADDAPGYNGYGDSGTIAVDPESVKDAIDRGKGGGARVYRHKVNARPVSPSSMSMNDQREYGDKGYHRAGWKSGYFYLTAGASYRQDPHV